MLNLGCVIFGIGVGNATTLPGLIVQQEFPKQHFARLISIVVAINQFTFAFGPTLLAQLQRLKGTYTAALLVCCAMEIAACNYRLVARRNSTPCPVLTRHLNA